MLATGDAGGPWGCHWEAVVTVQQLSAAMLRNMQMHNTPTKTIPAEHLHSFQHQVYRARKNLCVQQLKGFELNES